MSGTVHCDIPCSWDRIAVLNANFANTNCEGERLKFTLTALPDRQLEEIGASTQGHKCNAMQCKMKLSTLDSVGCYSLQFNREKIIQIMLQHQAWYSTLPWQQLHTVKFDLCKSNHQFDVQFI